MNAATDYVIMNENNGDKPQSPYYNQPNQIRGRASLPQIDYDTMYDEQAQQAKRGSLVLPKAPKTIIKKKGTIN